MEDQSPDNVLNQKNEQDTLYNFQSYSNNIQFPDLSSMYYTITQHINERDNISQDIAGFEATLIGMITPFLGKEMMYEPMRELRDRFPQWLENYKPKLSMSEFEHHSKQYEICTKIVKIYEEYPETPISAIVELLQQMGTPHQSLNEYFSELK